MRLDQRFERVYVIAIIIIWELSAIAENSDVS